MSDAKAWALEIDRDWAAQMGDLRDAVEYIGLTAISRIDARSPVDTGRFRANWTLSIGSPDTTTREAFGTWVPQNNSTMESYPVAGYPMVYLQNNLPYAIPLEEGSSMQAPGGMVAITTAELAAIWEGIEI